VATFGADVVELTSQLRGPVLGPGHPEYDAVRALYNGMIDKRPAVIARCRDVPDVISAVNFGRRGGLAVAIRGGGHNGAGLGSCDGGLVIDLSLMRGVDVDPATAIVDVQAGCTQGDVDRATHAFGLAVPLGIMSTTGVAGLTLGGGTGFLSRQYGLTIDSLQSADLVLSDGSLVTANAALNADLFWALRGGGGNFGVVTSLSFRAWPVRDVYAGPLFWNLDQLGQLMRWYRDFIPRAPRELNLVFAIKTVGRTAPYPIELQGVPVCGLVVCFNGSRTQGEEALRELRRSLPTPLLDLVRMMPFPDAQMMSDAALPKGLQWYWKGDFVDKLSDAAIEVHVEYSQRIPSALSLMHLYPIDGAVHDTTASDTAWVHRDSQWSMVIAGIDPDPARAAAITAWTKDYWTALHPLNPGGGYVNFMMADEGAERVAASYGANYARLQRVKRRYDPLNVFHVNQNITPATQEGAEANA
jgi:FAD/FMN-containing dehydrogenase